MLFRSSALVRFRDDILPALAPRASHLIVETWIARGDCGRDEARVTADVQATTERPPETEDAIVSLLRRAKESGVAPHILEVTCDEYAALANSEPSEGSEPPARSSRGGAALPHAKGAGGGKVDYARLLDITTRHLEVAVRQAAFLPRTPERPLVLVYGGALHNDLHPARALAAYSFAPASYRMMRGAFREVDLYVPELVLRLPSVGKEGWFRAWRRGAAPGRVVVVPRSDHSAVVVFPRDPSGNPNGKPNGNP